ncbi:MAG: S41 family peptidase [Pseudomonadota bacterium]
MPRFLLSLGLLCFSAAHVAAEDAGRWLREPTLSANGASIAFTYGGDIYRVNAEGGLATPLTITASIESNPSFSPDGRLIAYSSDRNGTLDVYLLNLETGKTSRLTFHEANDIVRGFSADGTSVLFESTRYNPPDYAADPHQAQPELYKVAVSGGTPTLITPVNALGAVEHADGGRFLYADEKGERFHRKHDDSPFARDIWELNIETNNHRRLTTNPWNDHTPAWTTDGEGFYFISGRSGTLNVWRQSAMDDENTAEQISFHTVHPVRDLSVATDGSLVYGFDGEIYRRLGSGDSAEDTQPLPIALPLVDFGSDTAVAETDGAVSEFVVSPNNDEVAFILRGDVYVTSLDFGTTQRITATPSVEADLTFSPDGRSLIYTAERFEQWSIFESSLTDEEDGFSRATRISEKRLIDAPVVDGAAVAVTQPLVSPDGSQLAYLSGFSEIRVFDRERQRSVSVVSPDLNYARGTGEVSFSWSPDSAYLAVTVQPDGRLFFNNIALVPADGSSAPVDLSRSGYLDTHPEWHGSGDLILWSTSRHGLRDHGGYDSLMDVYAQFLNQAAYDRFRRTKEDISLEDEEVDDEEEFDEEASVPTVSFDPAEFEERQLRLTIHSSDLGDFALNEEASQLYYLSAFEGGYDLWSHDFREEETSKLAPIGADEASMQLTADGEHLVVLADGVLSKVALADGEASVEPVPVDVRATVDVRAEREAMLHHIWQSARNHIFDPAVLDEASWDEMYTHYAGKLNHVHNNADFAAIARELVGELNVSHTNYGYRRDATEPTGALGVILDHSDHSDGIKISAVLTKGPLAKASDRVEAGHRLVAINDSPITGAANLYALLGNTVGKNVRVSLADGRARYDVVLKPVTHREERAWREEHWVEGRHQLVDELSEGRLGYVYVPEMSDASYRRIYSDVFGRHFAKEAIVIDVRDNWGGDLVSWLVALFNGQPIMWNAPNGRIAQPEPLFRWTKPSIALINQGAYSDGHCFVAAWQRLDVSTVVGTPVTGTCTFGGWESLVSGDVIGGTPTLGLKDADGDWLERKTTEPDVYIYPDPNRYSNGDDAMLAKAVEVLLQEIGENP